MKKYSQHSYADCEDPNNHHKKEHWKKEIEAKSAAHTPMPPSYTLIPWIHSENHPTDIIDEKGDFIARCLRSENAAFIVRAVNSHERLIDALQRAYGDYKTGTWDTSTDNYIKDTIAQTEKV